MSLKTKWTAPGCGATIAELQRLLGPQYAGGIPESQSRLQTNLEVEPYLEALTGYDRERATIAIARTLHQEDPCPEPDPED